MNTRYGAGNRTRTCTLLAVEPKSTESTNSTMPAFFLPDAPPLASHPAFRVILTRTLVNVNPLDFSFLQPVLPILPGEEALYRNLYRLFAFLFLTFPPNASRIDSVWCTLRLSGCRVSLITGGRAGVCVCASWRMILHRKSPAGISGWLLCLISHGDQCATPSALIF